MSDEPYGLKDNEALRQAGALTRVDIKAAKPARDALEAADDVHPDSVMGIMKDVAIVTPEAVEAAFAEQRKRYEAQSIEDRLAGCEAQLAEYAQAFLKVTAERDALAAGWPTCSGKWVKGSGGHRVHEPCGAPATWMHPDDMYAYCDAHIVHHDRPDYWQRSEFFDRTAELTARLSNERDALIRERDEARGKFVPFDRPHFILGVEHDMRVGPCACGAWHSEADWDTEGWRIADALDSALCDAESLCNALMTAGLDAVEEAKNDAAMYLETAKRLDGERAALCDRIVELLKERDAATARVAEFDRVLVELLATDGGEGSECWDATRFLAARNAVRALLAKEPT